MVENENKVRMAGRRTKKIRDLKEGRVSARNSRYTHAEQGRGKLGY